MLSPFIFQTSAEFCVLLIYLILPLRSLQLPVWWELEGKLPNLHLSEKLQKNWVTQEEGQAAASALPTARESQA